MNDGFLIIIGLFILIGYKIYAFHTKLSPCRGFSGECLLCDKAMACPEYLKVQYPEYTKERQDANRKVKGYGRRADSTFAAI